MREDSRRRVVTRGRSGARADLDIHRRLKPGASIALGVSGIALVIAGAVTGEWGLVGSGAAIGGAGLAFLWWDGY